MRDKVSPKRHALQNWAVACALGAAALPAWCEAPDGLPPDSYHDRTFDIRMERCVPKPVAACAITVTAKVTSRWSMSNENKLMNGTGVPTRAVAITMGGVKSSVPSRDAQRLEAGIPTKIDIEFASAVDPNEMRFLVVHAGPARNVTLRTKFVKVPD